MTGFGRAACRVLQRSGALQSSRTPQPEERASRCAPISPHHVDDRGCRRSKERKLSCMKELHDVSSTEVDRVADRRTFSSRVYTDATTVGTVQMYTGARCTGQVVNTGALAQTMPPSLPLTSFKICRTASRK